LIINTHVVGIAEHFGARSGSGARRGGAPRLGRPRCPRSSQITCLCTVRLLKGTTRIDGHVKKGTSANLCWTAEHFGARSGSGARRSGAARLGRPRCPRNGVCPRPPSCAFESWFARRHLNQDKSQFPQEICITLWNSVTSRADLISKIL